MKEITVSKEIHQGMFFSVSAIGVPFANLCGIGAAYHTCILCLKLSLDHDQLTQCSMQQECDFILPHSSCQEMQQGAAAPPQVPT